MSIIHIQINTKINENNNIVSRIDFPNALIATYLILSKIKFFLTIFLVPCIVVISTYLAIVTIYEVIRSRRVIYASPPVQ